MTRDEIIERGRRVLRLEREALAEAESRVGETFAARRRADRRERGSRDRCGSREVRVSSAGRSPRP